MLYIHSRKETSTERGMVSARLLVWVVMRCDFRPARIVVDVFHVSYLGAMSARDASVHKPFKSSQTLNSYAVPFFNQVILFSLSSKSPFLLCMRQCESVDKAKYNGSSYNAHDVFVLR